MQFLESNDSNDELRKVADALTAGTEMYANAIPQRQHRSDNSLFMESMAMMMDLMSNEAHQNGRANILTSVSNAQQEDDSNRYIYRTI